MPPPLIQHRDNAIHDYLADSIRNYLSDQSNKRIAKRQCATCGRVFKPRSRWNFCCQDQCRKVWYRGVFHPRPKD